MKRLAIVVIIGMFLGLTSIANAGNIGANCEWKRNTAGFLGDLVHEEGWVIYN